MTIPTTRTSTHRHDSHAARPEVVPDRNRAHRLAVYLAGWSSASQKPDRTVE